MAALQEVTVASFSPERFEALLGDRWQEVDEAIANRGGCSGAGSSGT